MNEGLSSILGGNCIKKLSVTKYSHWTFQIRRQFLTNQSAFVNDFGHSKSFGYDFNYFLLTSYWMDIFYVCLM